MFLCLLLSVSLFHLFFTKCFLYLFLWVITFLLSPIICVHFFFCHSPNLSAFDLLQEYTLVFISSRKKQCLREPQESNDVHSVPLSLVFIVVTMVNNVLFLFLVFREQRGWDWHDQPWTMADQRINVRLLMFHSSALLTPGVNNKPINLWFRS